MTINQSCACSRCLNHFKTEQKLQKHIKYCSGINECRIETHKYQENVPCTPKKNSIYMQKHIACSISYYIKCAYNDSLSKCSLYREMDCIDWFIDELNNVALGIDKVMKAPIPIIISPTQKIHFPNAVVCYICPKNFN